LPRLQGGGDPQHDPARGSDFWSEFYAAVREVPVQVHGGHQHRELGDADAQRERREQNDQIGNAVIQLASTSVIARGPARDRHTRIHEATPRCPTDGIGSSGRAACALRATALARVLVGTGTLTRPLSRRGGRVGLGGLGMSIALGFALADGHVVIPGRR
jgi:hypothetical protein